MKRIGLFLLAVVMVGMISCGGGGGSTSADSSSYDPTGDAWQFLVTTASAGDTMYTLTFFDSTGAKTTSGLFTAVSASGTSYSGTWTTSGSVVTGASSGSFSFTLTVNDDTTTGTIDYVTAEGSGTAPASRTDSTASGCSQYAGNWAGTGSTTDCEPGVDSGPWTMTVGSDCSASFCDQDGFCLSGNVVGNTVSFSGAITYCGGGTFNIEGTFTSQTSISGTISGGLSGSWSGAKQ